MNDKVPFMKPAPDCDDQLPLISRVGRGLQGNSYKVQIAQDSDCETYLEGMTYDAASRTWSTDWVSENINGGKMMYQYNLRPYTNPQTFTVTFRVKRPNREEWSWTTPAIPYLWDADDDGKADVDDIVGVGVADLFLKKTTEKKWNYPTVTASDYAAGKMTSDKHDKLVYPDDWDREQLNAPTPGEAYTVNLQYGVGGDIDAPNIDDIAKILGITVDNIRHIIKNSPVPTETITDENLKKYIDRRDQEESDKLENHMHTDMGFGSSAKDSNFISDGGTTTSSQWVHPFNAGINNANWAPNYDSDTNGVRFVKNENTIKQYVDDGDRLLNVSLINATNGVSHLWTAIEDILNKVYGGGTINKSTGKITWNQNGKIPVGNINILSSTTSNAILTHTGDATGDIKAE